MWTRLYRKGTSSEKGTLLQLKQLINRTSVPREPQKDMNASEDFLQVIFISHIIAAALQYFGMKSISDQPTSDLAIDSVTSFKTHVRALIDTYVCFEVPLSESNRQGCSGDGIMDYAIQVLQFCLLHAEFVDAVREGDGDRVIRCWRFLLPLFKSAARVNYSKEAINLLTQLLVLSPRLAHQITWSRFINVHGWAGHVSCDLHMEHLNRVCKMPYNHLVLTLTPKAITSVSKCFGPLNKATQQFDKETHVYKPHGTHSKASTQRDINKIVEELVDVAKVFQFTPGRSHPSFSSLSRDFYLALNQTKLLDWMKGHVK